MDFPGIDSFEYFDGIDATTPFFEFADRAAARLRAHWAIRQRVAVVRGSSVPATLHAGDERPGIRAALTDIARLTDVACGIGVGIAFAYPESVAGVLAAPVDLDRAQTVAAPDGPALHVALFICVRDDRSILESFRFAEMRPDGNLVPVPARGELALGYAFREVAELAVASVRDALGDGNALVANPACAAYAPLFERVGSRGRAYLERAVSAFEIGLAAPGAACEAAASEPACCTGARYRLRGDTFEPERDARVRSRCANHLVPLLESASAGLLALGIASDAWFAERAAGVFAASDCPACAARTFVPIVVTDRRVMSGARIVAEGLAPFFAHRGDRFAPKRACCVAHAARIVAATVGDRVACDDYGDDLHLAWTCDIRAFLGRGEAACGLKRGAETGGTSALYDFTPLRAPRFDVPVFLRSSALESR